MKKTQDKGLFFVLVDELSDSCEGYLFLADESLEPKPCALADLRSELSEDAVKDLVILMPGAQLLQLYIDAPRVSGAKLAKALYWSTEPWISTPIEDNEVLWRRAGLAENPHRCLTLVAAKTLLNQWRDLLNKHGLQAASLTSLSQFLIDTDDVAMLQWQDWTLWQDQQGMGCFSRVEIDSNLSESNPAKIALSLQNSDTGNEISLRKRLYQHKGFIDLAATEEQNSRWLSLLSWKPLTAALATCLVLLLSYFLIMGAAFHSRADEYQAQAMLAYQNWFPEDRRILNLRRQLEGKLRRESPVKSMDSITSLLDVTAAGLQQSSKNHSVERLRYQSQVGAMEMVAIVANMDEMEQLASLLDARNIEMEIQSATRRSAGLEVGILIQANTEGAAP